MATIGLKQNGWFCATPKAAGVRSRLARMTANDGVGQSAKTLAAARCLRDIACSFTLAMFPAILVHHANVSDEDAMRQKTDKTDAKAQSEKKEWSTPELIKLNDNLDNVQTSAGPSVDFSAASSP